jgi:hypothetical protein
MPFFDVQLGLFLLVATTVFLALVHVLICLTWDSKQAVREKEKDEGRRSRNERGRFRVRLHC